MMTALEVSPVTPAVGATVRGIDLTNEFDRAEIEILRAALSNHGVLIFRDQEITDADLVRFALRFGRLQPSPMTGQVTEEVHVLDSSTPRGEGADRWHSDQSFAPAPPMGSLLRAVRLPTAGGDTMFASMYAAYESLSKPMRLFLDGLTATHDVEMTIRRGRLAGSIRTPTEQIRERFPPVSHPVVRTHPETGRRALYVNSNSTVRINELSEQESAAVLALLLEHVRTPEVQTRVQWDLRTVVFWDNRCTQHYAVADYRERRVMHRVTLAGDRPF